MQERQLIGFACAYTPLVLLQAARFTPYRILPIGEAPDRAGSILHDNLCPHVKRILDRALADDLPELAGVVFMNSCDAMRRLHDGWGAARPRDRRILLDLPMEAGEAAVDYFASELKRLGRTLGEWGGAALGESAVAASAECYGKLYGLLEEASRLAARGKLDGGSAKLQELFNLSVTRPPQEASSVLEQAISEAPSASGGLDGRVPILIFGNVMPDPQAFSLFEECGVRVVCDDLCTASRMHAPATLPAGENYLQALARSILSRPRCARMLDPATPGALAKDVARRARESGARGVIAHVVKFCDPYLGRMPAVRDELRSTGFALLVLEGDCTMRSLEQHRTRIEAFVEMLR